MYIREGAKCFLRPPFTRRLAEQDILFGNLETPVVPEEKPSMLYKAKLRFNAPPALLDSLVDGGESGAFQGGDLPLFDVLSVVNNHSFDRGVQGLETTIDEVRKRAMVPVGMARELDEEQLAGRYQVIQRNGLNIGFVAFTWGINKGVLSGPTPGYVNEIPFGVPGELPDLAELFQLLRLCREEGADLLVASLHWGYEFEYYPSPNFMQIARLIAASGADLIIGHGPHVIQPLEVLHVNLPEYEGTRHYVRDEQDPSPRTCLVAYSLGNFSTLMTSDPCRIGALLSVEVTRAKQYHLGVERHIIKSAKLNLAYCQHESKLFISKPMTLYDVEWALSPKNPYDRLKKRVEEALDEVGSQRFQWRQSKSPWPEY